MNNHKKVSLISFIISAVFIVLGFYKMFAYDEGSAYRDPVNAYVGGDAYNYIINSNYAIGYFVLALLFTLIACTVLIIDSVEKMKNISEETETKPVHTEDVDFHQ